MEPVLASLPNGAEEEPTVAVQKEVCTNCGYGLLKKCVLVGGLIAGIVCVIKLVTAGGVDTGAVEAAEIQTFLQRDFDTLEV